MQTFNLLIATPEKTLFEGDVLSAIFPGSEGQFEILPNHAPIIASLKKGIVSITDSNNENHSIPIPGGFVEKSGTAEGTCILLT
ncbi:MAG: F0F1 ATP synthase subunit epsilon [Parachlamydiaceae bacterium]|nr:F0F1 ATP synthase subunit epsilon [Parachlamydiaceae bacterium]